MQPSQLDDTNANGEPELKRSKTLPLSSADSSDEESWASEDEISDDDNEDSGHRKSRSDTVDDFETVPKEEYLPPELYDSDERAEILALGTAMLRKKRKEDLVDASFNRYSFDDQDGLPQW